MTVRFRSEATLLRAWRVLSKQPGHPLRIPTRPPSVGRSRGGPGRGLMSRKGIFLLSDFFEPAENRSGCTYANKVLSTPGKQVKTHRRLTSVMNEIESYQKNFTAGDFAIRQKCPQKICGAAADFFLVKLPPASRLVGLLLATSRLHSASAAVQRKVPRSTAYARSSSYRSA